MFAVLSRKKIVFIIAAFFIIVCIFSAALHTILYDASYTFNNEEMLEKIEEICERRNTALLEQDLKTVEPLYDKNTRNSVWAYEHEEKKMKYLHNWADKQGIRFTDIKSKIKINYIKPKGSGFLINFINSTEYKYMYTDDAYSTNLLRIGTYHSLDLVKKDDAWVITREWYTDPFADSLNLDNLKVDEFKKHILSQVPRDFSNLNARRVGAVEYADLYCGAAADDETGFKYNKKYKDYNPLGGDCANFASQILHEGGKFKKTPVWNYDKGGGQAWLNAQAFKNYMLNSGRASTIAYGTYNKVFKASYKLLPGDFIAYEKKGKVTHISVVTGADSKGYSVVNCHNTDRYRVPWDLGWSDKGIKFWLVRVHY